MRKVTISVIIPTYNRASFLGETIASVQKQTLDSWECIVIDDGSTDYTAELMEFFVEQDSRISFHSRPGNRPKGANACRNLGFEKSSGDFIQWLDSDDILSSDKLELQLKQLLHTESDLVFSKWGRFSEGGEKKIFEDLDVYRSFDNPHEFYSVLADSVGYLPIHSYLMSRKAVLRAGRWFEYLSINQDGEFMARVISDIDKIHFSPIPVAYYRWKSQNNISLANSSNFRDLILSWQLIEAYLRVRFQEEKVYFVEKAKDRLIMLLGDNSEVIHAHKFFFQDQLEKRPSRLRKRTFSMLSKFRTGRYVIHIFQRIKNKRGVG